MGRTLKAVSVSGTVVICLLLATGTAPSHPPSSFENALADYDLQRIMAELAAATGEKQDFVILAKTNVQGADAGYSKEGLREIGIERAYFDGLGKREKWDAVFILAHEEGHFVFGHVGHFGVDVAPRQLAADSFAGFACYRLGATLDQTTHALKTEPLVARYRPGRTPRVLAAAYGWRMGHLTNSRFVIGLPRFPGSLF
jgi:hypothetical protein